MEITFTVLTFCSWQPAHSWADSRSSVNVHWADISGRTHQPETVSQTLIRDFSSKIGKKGLLKAPKYKAFSFLPCPLSWLVMTGFFVCVFLFFLTCFLMTLWVKSTFWMICVNCTIHFYIVVQPLSRVWLPATPWTAARQASLSFTISWSLLKLVSTESEIPLHWAVPVFNVNRQPFNLYVESSMWHNSYLTPLVCTGILLLSGQ